MCVPDGGDRVVVLEDERLVGRRRDAAQGPQPTLAPSVARYRGAVMSDDGLSRAAADDRAAIAGIVRTFFAAFTSGADCTARLDALREVFLPQAVIVRTCGGVPAVYGVDTFIAPRRELLSDGTLTDFREWELSGHTEIFGDIAQHFCSYAKAGEQRGVPFAGRGMKTLQFVRTPAGWRISAVAWDDERDGLAIEQHWSVAATH